LTEIVVQSENRNEITYICILYVLVVALDVTVRNNMKKTVYSRGGFTIAELLIVLMIIGILVGVSVPVFTAQLEKTREATDIANERDCKAIAVSSFLNDGTNGTFFL
jgi:prepilin-type N-terminal cleavage/methylation domain-containing protein